MSRRISLDSAFFLATLTAVFYTWSTAHYHGYIGTLGLSAEMMERSFHQTIYDGFLISIGPLLLALIGVLFLLWIYSHGIIPGYINWLKTSFKGRRNVIKSKYLIFAKPNAPTIEKNAKIFFVKFALFAMAGLLYFITLYNFEQTGKGKAERLLESASSGTTSPSRLMRVSVNGELKDLVFIGCGVRNCAGLDEHTYSIYYIDSSQGYSFTYKQRK